MDHLISLLEVACEQKNMQFDIDIQDCRIICLKKLFSYLGVEKLLVAQSPKHNFKVVKVEATGPANDLKLTSDSSNDDGEAEFELVGHPLECPFESFTPATQKSEDSTKHAELLSPKSVNMAVKVQVARQLLGIYNSIIPEEKDLQKESIPLIVLCDGMDCLKTFLLGSFYQNKTVTTISATFLGSLSPKAFPSLASIREEHLRSFQSISSARTESEVFCQYSILDSEQHNDDENSSSLTVDCHWKKVISLLESPAANAVCKMFIKVVPGEERSPAYAIYKELLFLKRLLQGIKTGEMVWIAKSSETSALDNIKNLILGFKEGSHWRKIDSQNVSNFLDTSDFDTFLEAVVLGKRRHIEFTDHLWTALSGCESYGELKESLELVVTAIQDATIKPVVLQTNRTILGKWMKSIRENEYDAVDVSLEGSLPLKLLLELGIEKLKKDYSAIFVGLELATEELLQPFLVYNSNLEKATDLLQKLHCTVELIVMCKTYLQLSREILGGFARQAVKFYTLVDKVLPSHQFEFPVQLSAVRKAISGLQPLLWEVCYKTCSGMYTEYTCCQLSLEPPLSYLNAKHSLAGENSNELQYFCTTVTCIQDSSF